MAFVLADNTSGFQPLITLAEDGVVTVGEAIVGSDVAEGAVEADLVVVGDEGGGDAPGVVKVQRRLWSNRLFFEGAVKAFDLTVALRIMR